MKNFIVAIFVCTSFLYAQEYRIGVNSSITTTISEDILNLFDYNPDNQYMYFYGIDFKIKLLEKYSIYSGVTFQFGNKLIGKYSDPINFTINNLDIEYVRKKRNINISILKIPLIYSISLNGTVNLNSGLYFGWNQFKLENTGDIILESGEKYSKINDVVYKDKYFIEPLMELDVKLITFLNFNFSVTYKSIEYSINTDLPDFYNLDFATERYKYKLSGLFYTCGLCVKI